jgi:hypothetical protein
MPDVQSERVEPVDVKLLVPITWKEVEADHTFTDVIPTVRFLVYNKRPIRVELLLDLVNKYNRRNSRPDKYFWLSTPEQLQTIGNTGLALAVLLAFHHAGRLDPSPEEVSAAVKTLLEMSSVSIADTLNAVLRDLRMHSEAIKRSTLGGFE